MKNSKFKVGQCVVYTAPNGASISAKVYLVDGSGVHVEWLASFKRRSTAFILHRNTAEMLTPFGNSLFLAL